MQNKFRSKRCEALRVHFNAIEDVFALIKKPLDNVEKHEPRAETIRQKINIP